MYFLKQTLSGNYGPKKKPHSGGPRSRNRDKKKHSPTKRANTYPHQVQSPEEVFDKTVFCSDLYTREFILEEFKAVAENGEIYNLTFEDIIERNDAKLLQTAKVMLVDASMELADKNKTLRGRPIPTHDIPTLITAGEEGEDEEEEHIQMTFVKRPWEAITFIGCISTARDYKQYLDKKHQFQADLNRLLAVRRLKYALPIRFKTKLEIHSMLPVFSILKLLQEVARDSHIAKLRLEGGVVAGFDEARDHPRRVAKQFAKLVDPVAMEWTGPPVEIFLRYGGEDMNIRTSRTKLEPEDDDDENHATEVLRACARALEGLLSDGLDE
ncbi:expressed unknown protein [Seminavis robusta]|uniref:Uncharacterized protein n=1 Tax=Seminavis robusta TaxID=568900 RepID=A0A9N8EQC4_9STRA|nr:expressed unknown protein [Seminavis robusta]|eukprot:Sro1388_g268490.1 n/a (326) ;mRNA; f:27078-28158